MATPATKFCAVCGDVAKCHNFGVLSCESCKSFFRRQVLHKNFASLRCTGVRERPCFISVAKRSRCRLCRINRCLDIGMGKNFFSPSNCNGKTVDSRKIAYFAGGNSKFGHLHSDIVVEGFLSFTFSIFIRKT